MASETIPLARLLVFFFLRARQIDDAAYLGLEGAAYSQLAELTRAARSCG